MKMNSIMIPPEAVEAAARALHSQWIANNATPANRHEYREWEELISIEREGIVKEATAALRAGIAAWPGMHVFDRKVECEGDYVYLPLPQETRDE